MAEAVQILIHWSALHVVISMMMILGVAGLAEGYDLGLVMLGQLLVGLLVWLVGNDLHRLRLVYPVNMVWGTALVLINTCLLQDAIRVEWDTTDSFGVSLRWHRFEMIPSLEGRRRSEPTLLLRKNVTGASNCVFPSPLLYNVFLQFLSITAFFSDDSGPASITDHRIPSTRNHVTSWL